MNGRMSCVLADDESTQEKQLWIPVELSDLVRQTDVEQHTN